MKKTVLSSIIVANVMTKNIFVIFLSSICLMTLSSITQADDCTSVPSSCARANNRGTQLINNFPNSTGITDAASSGYCAMLVGIEVNSYCADQYRAAGRNHCARLLEQQVAEYRKALPQYQAVIDAASVSRIRNACSWK